MGDIVIQLLPHVLAAIGYAALGFHFWKTRWHEPKRTPSATDTVQRRERAAIGLTMMIQAYGLRGAMFIDGNMFFSFSLALALILWLAVLIYWLESFRSRMDGLQPLVLPLAALCALLPALFPQARVIANASASGFKFHFLTAMLAYSLVTLAALHAVFMSFAEASLHRHALTRRLASLPPLLTMEALLFRMIFVAFALLTVALGSGVLFSEEVFGRALSFDHKTVFGFLSWGIFAVLLAGRHFRGWRGRKALRWTLAGFMSLLLAYVGSRFVLEVLLGRV